MRGTIALNLGHTEIARDALITAAKARPNAGRVWQTLTMLGSAAKDAEVAAMVIDAAPHLEGGPVGERAAYYYALGKVRADLGEHDHAFAAFARGAQLVASERGHDPALDRALATNAIAGWSADTIASAASRIKVPSDRPIIVTGLPRSGSTLVEQILVSHSRVSDGDELGKFGLVAAEIGGTHFPAFERWSAQNDPNQMSRLYLHLLEQRFGAEGRVVDKSLEASRYLGTLAALMPNTPILWMRRNPLDNAWSCFHTYFLSGVNWSWSQEAIAEHMRLEDDLLARWQDILGDRLLVVEYEALVRDKAAAIPILLDFCGLQIEEAAFNPERTARLVTTNSVSQVRQPINTRAIGSAEPYRAHLAPFIARYRALGGNIQS